MVNQPDPATVGSTGLHVAFVATYVPRQCGIATFTHDLVEAVRAAPQDIRPRVIAVDRGEGLSYPPAVAATLAVSDRASYRSLGRCLADDGVQLISLQHEYGIFGGRSGEYVQDLLENSPVPVVSTLHTLLTQPTRTQERILRRIAEQSARLVTMSQRGRAILVERYNIDPARIVVIPHGVPSFDSVDRRAARAALGLDHGTVVLSAGLLGPHKNVELVLEALARIADKLPDVVYAVVGATHPELRKRFGEAYRLGLEDRVRSLGLDGRVRFVDRYLSRDELMTWLAASDVFVTPYRNPQQIASGTLAYALAAGCAVVSTPYEHALELLGQGRGVLFPFDDADALSDALWRLLTDDQERERIGQRARAHGRTMTWPTVAARYASLFSTVRSERAVERRAAMRRPVAVSIDGSGRGTDGALRPVDPVPPPARRHLDQIRDRVGVIQFAVGQTPDRRDGYCTDDVARALRVDLRHQALEPGPATTAAIWVDLRFLAEALDPDTGRFRNLRTAAGRWPETIGSEDAHGRAIQALGEAVSSPDRAVAAEARGLLANALPAAARLEWARPQAYSILGCAAALDDARSSEGGRHVLVTLLDRLEQRVSRARSLDPQWPWPEERCTYDNGVIAEALITGGLILERPATVRLGLDVLLWLFDAETGPDGRLRPIGNDGWWEPGRGPARWEQQPIEPASLLSAAVAARGATGDDSWGRLAERAYAWFLGANDLGVEVADPQRGACHDGLGPGGLNVNQGAESTLVWLMSVERMRDLAEVRTSTLHGPGRGQDRTYSITSDKRAVARATVESAAP